ncbi:MAG: hypothetical protein V3U43_01890 [Pseudomonadales bacterium]
MCRLFWCGSGRAEQASAANLGGSQMTQNQIPGIGTHYNGWHDEASWGLGWMIQSHERWP